jgi:predicted AlkP superfamily phosphohydrolase/phosphomutase
VLTVSKVLLIGIDGATFSVLDPLIRRGVMPFLGRLQQNGARAPLASVVPPLTPPAWTSLMTGRPPGAHGVYDFFRMDSPVTRHIHFVTSGDVQCETIWEYTARHDLKVTALNFPLMFPPPKIPGYIIPGWVPWRQLRLACWPNDLFDRLQGKPGFEPRELAMDIQMEEKATEGCADSELIEWVDLHIRREYNWYQVLKYLMTEDRSPLTAVIFDGTDRLQHLCWRFIDSDGSDLQTELEQQIHQRTMAYFRQLDEMLESIVGLAGPETTTVLASDHGFGPTRAVFHVNQWLASRGYLHWAKPAESREDGPVLGVGQVARHTYEIDWERTRVFATTPTSNGLYILTRDQAPAGVPQEDYPAFRDRLVAELLAVPNPATGEPMVTRIWTREEAFAGPAAASAPDLTLELCDGGLFSILPSESIVSQRPEVAGAHRPDGVFLAAGPDIEPGTVLPSLSILDVAPLILHSLGLEVPMDMEGRVPEAILKAGSLASRPVRIGAGGVVASPDSRWEQQMGPDEEAALMERLRQLGYVE